MRAASFAIALAVAVLALPRAAEGQSVPPANVAKVFATVDAVSVSYGAVVVTGILQGEATPSTWRVDYSSSYTDPDWAAMCQRNALLAMSRPGQYLLEIFNGSTSTHYCKLTRVNP